MTVLKVVLLVLLAYVVFLVAVPLVAWSRVDRVDAAPGGERPAAGSGTTYLLVGSDSRAGLTEAQRDDFGTGSAAGRRTDTIMLLHVPSGFGSPVLISVPRDSYVPIPGYGWNKVNAAFAFGGPTLLVQTLEETTGLRIEEYVEIGFGGFVGVVDAVRGVELCLEQPIEDAKAHLDLPAGCQRLDGPEALGYVRARSFDPRSDLGRVERQQEFLGALFQRAASPATLLNPIRYTRLGLAGGDALTVGQETGLVDVGRFALAMRAISAGDGVTMTVPISDPDYASPVGSAVRWDSDQALALFKALERGRDVPADLIPEEQGGTGT